MIFSPEALRDIDDIEQYISLESVEAARRTVDVLFDRLRVLDRFPEFGRERPDLYPGIRSLPINDYVVFYRIGRHNVEIARILHGRRDIESALNFVADR